MPSRRCHLVSLALVATIAASCGSDGGDAATTEPDPDQPAATAAAPATDAPGSTGTEPSDGAASEDASSTPESITIGAIPDQDPEKIARNYGLLADYLAAETGVEVDFQPVTEYEAAVSGFRVGDLDLVWFGGLTGVQARLQVDGAEAIAQRDIDAEFTSVFIAGTDTDLEPVEDVAGLAQLADHSFTFGSESSTSGRLMPQSFLDQAGVSIDDFDGEPGFSGAHDKTIALVESGTYDAGALNSQVWASAVEDGSVDLDAVQLIFESPTYYDYHWVARPELGSELTPAIVEALGALDPADPEEAEILDFFGATSFIGTESSNYDDIEAVGRASGLIE
ncbi:putative selenate ABC transporter substrate-binding protein [Ilumatobacter sp.]|uniref:putative selenate ABC transporter substrate-binding protein n=1 Tax=Ilumatobacter sp. TaxID=1967498 RepID=UPI003B51F666